MGGVEEACERISNALSGKQRESVRCWPAYLAKLFRNILDEWNPKSKEDRRSRKDRKSRDRDAQEIDDAMLAVPCLPRVSDASDVLVESGDVLVESADTIGDTDEPPVVVAAVKALDWLGGLEKEP